MHAQPDPAAHPVAAANSSVSTLFDAINGAIIRQQWGAVPALLRTAGANLRALSQQRDLFGSTILIEAIGAGQSSVVAQLIQGGADLEYAHREGFRPLWCAVVNKQLGIARQLVDAGADLDARVGTSAMTALMKAISLRQEEMALYFIAQGAYCCYDASGAGGLTTAMGALDFDLPPVYLAIVSRDGVAPDVSPLALAVQRNALACMQACLTHPVLAQPAHGDGFSGLVGACTSAEARHLLLAWKSEQAVLAALPVSALAQPTAPRVRSKAL